MNHQIIEPHKDLATLVKCYWTLEIPKEKIPKKNTIVPDGCMKMIFHYGDSHTHLNEKGESITLPKCFVIGQLTRPYNIKATGETGIFFVCFHPYGFLPFARFPVKEMENTAVSLMELFGKDGQEIQQTILNANSTYERINLIESFLFKKIVNTQTIDLFVKSTVETIFTANGQLSVDQLSELNKINRRQLARKFSSHIGLSPKQLSKTIRIGATLKMLLTGKMTSLTKLAYENKYYDQAHFIKEFKEFTGLTPKEFYDDILKMSCVFH